MSADFDLLEPAPLPVGIGVIITLGLIGAGIWTVGLVDSLPLVLVSGILGAAVTGWITARDADVTWSSQAVIVGVLQGVLAAGIAGVVFYGLVITGAMGTTVAGIIDRGEGGAYLLLIASPLAFVLFGLEGVVGGALGGVAYVLTHEA